MSGDFEFDVREIPLTPPIGVLIDAGVNRGQFARVALPWFQPGRYCGFEPIPDLARAAAAEVIRIIEGLHRWKTSHNWCVVPAALGACYGRSTIHRSLHDPSSSLLPLALGAGDAYGIDMREVEAFGVPLESIDGWCSESNVEEIDLLKIDVQGYEGRVLRGAREMLKRTKFVVVEVLFCQHYIGQSSPEEIDQLLREGGLKFIKWLRRHPNAENPLEGDALYGRAE